MSRFASSIGCVLLFLTACAAEEPCPGGGREVVLASAGACAYPSAIVVEGGFTCPASLPVRYDFESATVCAPPGFDHREIEDDECVRASIDCAPRVEGCEGSPPDIASCERGAAWADCGGLGEPRFACIPDGASCFWFVGGCVAEGYVASRCEAEDICCIGDYPYGSSWREFSLEDAPVFDFLNGWGTEPWDAVRAADLEVSIAALPAAERAITCTGDIPGGPCGESELGVFATYGGAIVTRVISTRASSGGWTLVVEVIRDPVADAWVARACRVPFTDGITYACSTTREPTCATSGTVELAVEPSDAVDPATLRMRVAASFDDGTAIDLEL